LSSRLLRLPLYFDISSTDQSTVCERISQYFHSRANGRTSLSMPCLGEPHAAAI
jgi:hypothetical protein